MWEYIIVLFFIILCLYCIILKKKFFTSLSFTISFILVLWVNIPCFINLSSNDLEMLGLNNKFLILPFILNEQLSILYIIIANIALGVLLLWQSAIINKKKYTYDEIKKIYDEFGRDAIELYVIGRDLDFLYKENFEKQTDRIEHLRDKCNLLCEFTSDEKLLELYKKVSEHGVQIKYYTQNDDIINLKGQMKTDQSGVKKAIFTSKSEQYFRVLYIENQFLISTIINLCNKVYKKFDV